MESTLVVGKERRSRLGVVAEDGPGCPPDGSSPLVVLFWADLERDLLLLLYGPLLLEPELEGCWPDSVGFASVGFISA